MNKIVNISNWTTFMKNGWKINYGVFSKDILCSHFHISALPKPFPFPCFYFHKFFSYICYLWPRFYMRSNLCTRFESDFNFANGFCALGTCLISLFMNAYRFSCTPATITAARPPPYNSFFDGLPSDLSSRYLCSFLYFSRWFSLQ